MGSECRVLDACLPFDSEQSSVLSPVGLMLEWFKYRMFGFVGMRPWLLDKVLENRFRLSG